jgi:hypothetical protein
VGAIKRKQKQEGIRKTSYLATSYFISKRKAGQPSKDAFEPSY